MSDWKNWLIGFGMAVIAVVVVGVSLWFAHSCAASHGGHVWCWL